MNRRKRLWRYFDRLLSYVPGGPDEQTLPPSIPDPNEPGISSQTRRARLRLLVQRYEKGSRGSGR